LQRLEQGARRLTEAAKRNACDAYAEAEKTAGERWMGEVGPWSWVADPVPQGRYFEAVGIHSSKSDLADLADADFVPLAQGLLKIFSYLESQGLWSFNLALMGLPDAGEHFRCQVRLVPRTFFPPTGCSDVHFDVLENEPMILRSPEEVAKELEAYFG
jgi:galactose-1-phosphate uridylyltransferase